MASLAAAAEALVSGRALGDGELTIESWHGHAALGGGFRDDASMHRRTDAMARLPDAWLHPFPGAFTLDVRLAGGIRAALPPYL